jgi:hypothetical protein
MSRNSELTRPTTPDQIPDFALFDPCYELVRGPAARAASLRFLKGDDMAIVAMFEVEGATAEKYDEVIRRLTLMGLRVPDGQMYHICYGDKRRLQVINVFENQAKLDAFAAKLMPILQDMAITAKPQIFDIHNIIAG